MPRQPSSWQEGPRRLGSSIHPPSLPLCRAPPQGYQLTDKREGGGGGAWAFPPGASLAPRQYLVVFASGKDRAAPGKPLHTSFKLSADDAYVALLAPGSQPASAVDFPE